MNDTLNLTELVAEMVRKEINAGAEKITMTRIEQTTRQILFELGQKVAQAVTQGMAKKYPDHTSKCQCGQEAKYIRRREAKMRTLFGQVAVKRAYYICPNCRQGHCPLDQKLGLRPNALSAELARLVGMTGVHMPYGKGSHLFEELTQVKVTDPCLAKTTGQIGETVIKQEKRLKQQATDPDYLLKRRQKTKKPLRLYGAIDATKVHVRQDGECLWRDLKVGAWFQAKGKPPHSPDGNWTIQAENIHYYADIAPASEFSSLFWATAVAYKADLAHELIILGDGAEWIWNLVDENFPDAIQILDWFHASEYLMPLAQAAFSQKDEQNQWVTMAKKLMWNGDIDRLLLACRQLQTISSADLIRTTINYFVTHSHRMRYAHFRKQGFQIGSGTIESAAKQIGLMRMKVPGATWNTPMAIKVAKARAAYLSDQWLSLPLAV